MVSVKSLKELIMVEETPLPKMIFVLEKITTKGAVPEINMVIRSYIKTDELSRELMIKIREELGLPATVEVDIGAEKDKLQKAVANLKDLVVTNTRKKSRKV